MNNRRLEALVNATENAAVVECWNGGRKLTLYFGEEQQIIATDENGSFDIQPKRSVEAVAWLRYEIAAMPLK